MVRLLDCSKESVQMYSTERKIVRLPTYTLFEEKRFIYNGEQLIAELDEENNIQKEYIWGNDVANKSSLGQTSTGGVGALVGLKVHNSNNTISSYAYISDNIGNIVALVDKKGKIVNKYSYSPFGERNIIKEDIAQDFGFNTKIHDDTGLVYYNNRYYNVDLGRFITRDPIREVGGSNLYSFVGNDPVNNYDVLGKVIYLQTHRVNSLYHYQHLSLFIVPDNQNANYILDYPFLDYNGKKGITLGAGPSGVLTFGYLEAGYNRTRDMNTAIAGGTNTILHPPSGLTEDEFIQQLLTSQQNFINNFNNGNQVEYQAFPNPGEKEANSNSYINYLLQQSGINQEQINNVFDQVMNQISNGSWPGFNQPIPTNLSLGL